MTTTEAIATTASDAPHEPVGETRVETLSDNVPEAVTDGAAAAPANDADPVDPQPVDPQPVDAEPQSIAAEDNAEAQDDASPNADAPAPGAAKAARAAKLRRACRRLRAAQLRLLRRARRANRAVNAPTRAAVALGLGALTLSLTLSAAPRAGDIAEESVRVRLEAPAPAIAAAASDALPSAWRTPAFLPESAVAPVTASGLAAAQAFYADGDFEAAARAAANLARQDDPQAQFFLAGLYAQGRGVLRDGARAVRLYQLAANAGLAEAQTALGVIALGRGAPAIDGRAAPDLEMARIWLERAAAAGDAQANMTLASVYERGLGVPADPGQAYAHYEAAAARGVREAMAVVGARIAAAPAATPALVDAAPYLEAAAEAGAPSALYNLSLLAAAGYNGREQDLSRAADLMLKAAAGDFAPAYLQAGLYTEQGLGDVDTAPSVWYARAADAGDAEGRLRYARALMNDADRQGGPKEVRRLARLIAEDRASTDAMKDEALALVAALDARVQPRIIALRD